MKKSLLVVLAGAATALAMIAGTSGAATGIPPQHEIVRSVLPPGNASTVTVLGQAAGMASGDRSKYGPNTDDQRELYWNDGFKSSNFSRSGTPETPKSGVQIYHDAYGVPAVYASTTHDIWYGVGFSAAQQRLFLMDGVRRSAEGTLSELTGPSGVPADVQARVLGYTDAEYKSFFDALSSEAQQAFLGYADGVNAYLAKITADPTLLPAEYALLQTTPAKWTVKDSLASGVFMTRFVASEGGNEMTNVADLNELKSKLGPKAGSEAWQDLHPLDDSKAVTTIQPQDATFSNADTPVKDRPAAYATMSAWAGALPAGLASGPGTGAYPVPSSVGAPSPAAILQAKMAAALNDWRAHLHGGSYAIALSGSKTTTGKPILESAPQLGWTNPSYLYEVEVHGAGYDDRGVTVPGLPVVGIGYNANVAWGLTTGYSKTIDSFIETTRTSNGRTQYLHDGKWLDESCRTEVVRYRNAPDGVPVSPAFRAESVQVCRTLHGPVVASAGGYQRSVQYAMWMHEPATIEGVLGWDKAKNLTEFAAATSKVTWNENVTAADSSGNIGYWHPGRYPVRANGTDQRFPTPGTGAYDWRGYRPFAQMPHVVNPKEGILSNWNNIPAQGWTAGEDYNEEATPADRMGVIRKLLLSHLSGGQKISPDEMVTIDRYIGDSDARARVLTQPLLDALKGASLTATQRDGYGALLAWNRQAGGGESGEQIVSGYDSDSPAATLFSAYRTALTNRLMAGLSARQQAELTHIEHHIYNTTRIDSLALRIVDPTVSSVRIVHDWTHGLGAITLQRKAFADAVAAMVKEYGSDFRSWRREHPTTALSTLTGIVGAPTIDMRYEDRGSWIQLVQFT